MAHEHACAQDVPSRSHRCPRTSTKPTSARPFPSRTWMRALPTQRSRPACTNTQRTWCFPSTNGTHPGGIAHLLVRRWASANHCVSVRRWACKSLRESVWFGEHKRLPNASRGWKTNKQRNAAKNKIKTHTNSLNHALATHGGEDATRRKRRDGGSEVVVGWWTRVEHTLPSRNRVCQGETPTESNGEQDGTSASERVRE